jgi:hypothetical protein
VLAHFYDFQHVAILLHKGSGHIMFAHGLKTWKDFLHFNGGAVALLFLEKKDSFDKAFVQDCVPDLALALRHQTTKPYR